MRVIYAAWKILPYSYVISETTQMTHKIHLYQWNTLLIKSARETEPDWEHHGPESTASPVCTVPRGAASLAAAQHRDPGAPVTTW